MVLLMTLNLNIKTIKMIDFIKWVVSGIIPPQDVHNDALMYRWYTAVSASIFAWSGALVVVTLLAFGLTPFYKGFALATDIDKQSNMFVKLIADQQDTRVRNLNIDLMLTAERQCRANATNNLDAIRFATENIRDLMDQYYLINKGRQWVSPTCRELGIN